MCNRIKWTPQEDQILKQLKQQKNIESWKQIAEQANAIFGKNDKTGKQCRERYINYVRFGQNIPISKEWTLEEDEVFTQLYLENGPKWCLIAQKLCSKSENLLKNRFYGGLRRIIKRITKVEKCHRVRKTKPIRYETLIRILDFECTGLESLEEVLMKNKPFECFVRDLKIKILQGTWDILNGSQSEESIIQLIEEIHFLNTQIKKSYSKKVVQDKREENETDIMKNIEKSLVIEDHNDPDAPSFNLKAQQQVSQECKEIEAFRLEGKLNGHQNMDDNFKLPQYNLNSSGWREKPISYDLQKQLAQILNIQYASQAFDFV